MPAWLLEFILGQIVKLVVAKWGHTNATNKIADELEKNRPLTPDPLPSPKAKEGPIEPHFGD